MIENLDTLAHLQVMTFLLFVYPMGVVFSLQGANESSGVNDIHENPLTSIVILYLIDF